MRPVSYTHLDLGLDGSGNNPHKYSLPIGITSRAALLNQIVGRGAEKEQHFFPIERQTQRPLAFPDRFDKPFSPPPNAYHMR